MTCFSYQSIRPVVGQGSFIHPAASLIGDVIIGADCYVGPSASLRGDFGRIIVEDGSNLQDNCVMHSFPGEDCIVERDGHVGHGAVLHGCHVRRNALFGIGAVLMRLVSAATIPSTSAHRGDLSRRSLLDHSSAGIA
jgi:phenylacetic acid degradation protein